MTRHLNMAFNISLPFAAVAGSYGELGPTPGDCGSFVGVPNAVMPGEPGNLGPKPGDPRMPPVAPLVPARGLKSYTALSLGEPVDMLRRAGGDSYWSLGLQHAIGG